jgi:flagellar basal-body rod protein FlgB
VRLKEPIARPITGVTSWSGVTMQPREGEPLPSFAMSLVDSTQLTLEAAMQGSMLRQTLLNNNLANADTPGYQPEDVSFQSQLQAAIQSGQPLDQITVQPTTETQTLSADGNGVSPEQTEASIAENGLLYSELADVAGARESILKTAIGTA